MKEKVAVSKRLSENIAQMEEFFHECDDIKKKELMILMSGSMKGNGSMRLRTESYTGSLPTARSAVLLPSA